MKSVVVATLTVIVCCAMLFVLAGPAAAQASSHSIGPAKPDFITGSDLADLAIDQFDPARGTLISATVTVQASVTSEFSNVANGSSMTADLTPQVELVYCLDLAANGATTSAGCESSADAIVGEVKASELFADVGPNGSDVRSSATPVTSADSTQLTYTGADLAPFIGTGQLPYRFSADASIDMSGPGDGQMAWNTLASGAVTVDYVYGSIQVEKATNGVDADVDPVALTVGDPVEWTYTITNTGTTTLLDVEVADDILGPICVVGTLAPGAASSCSAAGAAELGDYVNVATVTGVPEGSDQQVSDTDPSRYRASEPTPEPTPTSLPTSTPIPTTQPVDYKPVGLAGVDIELATNGHDADLATGPFVAAGDPIVWSYVVRNPGAQRLTNLIVTDDTGATVCTRASLEVGQSFTCERAGAGADGEHRLVATVRATAASGSSHDDIDPTHYHGAADEVLATVSYPADQVLANTGDGDGPTIVALAVSTAGLAAFSLSETLRRRNRRPGSSTAAS